MSSGLYSIAKSLSKDFLANLTLFSAMFALAHESPFCIFIRKQSSFIHQSLIQDTNLFIYPINVFNT